MNTLLLAAAKRRSTELPDLEYFGIESLIGGSTLAIMLGVTAGVSINTTSGFLKFARKGKLIYVARRAFRHSITWDHLNVLDLITGNRTVTFGGKTYKVRLLTGGNGNPSSAPGGEWDELMYAVSSDRPVDYTGPVLANLTASTLWFGEKSQIRFTLCQETWVNDSKRCITRGGLNASSYSTIPKTLGDENSCWRPVLEPVE